ncbi:uncharacterized protein BX663DRAFT_512489 [Cokeromyces recurvatus]|uniref:uncharacterized protein n=1 Tax=Cokeromyces recurvatus TaxID=90255 RepID=UPI0022210ABB|nr:uncharacterized protein BX663DRAFT_512489 [Cokeromyces recurvatus]KAI7901809.1 hypothetical protein BX663DRAFT_512489 [Cokeromyces recurvatus]
MNTQKQDYSPFILTGPYYHHHQLNSPPTHTSSSFHTNRTVSSLPITNFSYGNDLQQPQPQPQQDSVSIASSSPSIGFMSPPSFGLYNQDQHGILSSSSKEINQPFCSFTNIVSAPIVPSNVSDTNKSQTTSELATPISINNTKSVKRRKSGKTGHIHRTLSYESVMSLTDFNVNINTKRNNSLSPTLPSPLPRSLPSQPLDHDKVMEALRAKLRKSSSPSQAHKSKPSLESTPPPPPLPPPPPNTNPTTGILLLNLKNRRRKVSITKRGNNDYGSSSKP